MKEEKEVAYFAEEGFANWMAQEVEPYLKAHRQCGFFQSGDGTSVYYIRYLNEEAEKCIIICHGFCEFAEKYNEIIFYFLQMGFSVCIPEHRGHGNSSREVADKEMVHVENYQKYVDDFVQCVQTVVKPQQEHCFLFAHSMGGAIGALVLEQHPSLFEAAILSSPMCQMLTGRWPNGLACLAAWIFCRLGKSRQYALGQSGFCGEEDFAWSSCLSEVRYRYIFEKRLKNENYRTSGGSYGWVYAGLHASRQLMRRNNLRQITVPILLFEAGMDHMVSNQQIERFAGHTGNTKLVVIGDAKHEIFNADITARRKYYEEIFTFLRKQK